MLEHIGLLLSLSPELNQSENPTPRELNWRSVLFGTVSRAEAMDK